MKKTSLLLMIILCLTLFAACGAAEPVYTAEDVAGRIYLYEGEGCGGNFTITLNEDGTFQYYEGWLSSYIGMGTWTLSEDGVLRMQDKEMGRFNADGSVGTYVRVNYFKVEKDCLVWMAENSDNFLYVDVADGERFHGSRLPTVPTLDEVRQVVLGQNTSAEEDELLQRLRGFKEEDFVAAWGQPDVLSGLYGSIWILDETCSIIVYYGDGGYLTDVKLSLSE